VLGIPALVALLVVVTAGSAQAQNKCLAGKNKCASKKIAGLLKCHAKAEKSGTALDPTCTQKVTDKFDGGAVPAKGCFAKLEAKNVGPCVTTNDTAAVETTVDNNVTGIVTQLDPGYPTPVTNKCSAGKKLCVSKKIAAIMKCHEKAVKTNTALNPACVQKAIDKYDGGATPAKGCFAKLEAKNTCLTTSDFAALETTADNTVQQVLCQLNDPTIACGPPPTPTATITPSPTATPTCAPGPVVVGSLTPTLGRFNYNSAIGLPAANGACSTNFSGAHACTYFELQCAQAAGSLVGLQDTAATSVTSLWAIDPSAAALSQCVDDAVGGSNLRWEYGTAHTVSRGERVALNNGAGTLGPLQLGQLCALGGTTSWVGCCQ
jgi:hypothetical protein